MAIALISFIRSVKQKKEMEAQQEQKVAEAKKIEKQGNAQQVQGGGMTTIFKKKVDKTTKHKAQEQFDINSKINNANLGIIKEAEQDFSSRGGPVSSSKLPLKLNHKQPKKEGNLSVPRKLEAN